MLTLTKRYSKLVECILKTTNNKQNAVHKGNGGAAYSCEKFKVTVEKQLQEQLENEKNNYCAKY